MSDWDNVKWFLGDKEVVGVKSIQYHSKPRVYEVTLELTKEEFDKLLSAMPKRFPE